MPTLVGIGQITITDVMDGSSAAGISMNANGAGFTFVNDVASPASQRLVFTASRSQITTTTSFSTSNGAVLATDAGLLPIANYALGIYGAGEGDTAYLDLSQFGSAEQLIVTASAGVYSTSQTVLRLNKASTLTMSATGQSFNFVDGVATPSTQLIAVTALRTGAADPVSFIASNGVTLATESRGLTMLGYALGLLDSGDLDTCYVDLSDFGSSDQLVVTAAAGGLSATHTLVKNSVSTAQAGANQTYVDASGTIQGVSSGAGTSVKNSLITIGADGVLSGAGGGGVTLDGIGQSTFRVSATGASAIANGGLACGFYQNGTNSASWGGSRSYTVVKIKRDTNLASLVGVFDVFASAANATAMTTALNTINSDHVVVVYSFDEPQGYRLSNGLDVAMYRHGASRAVYGSSNFKYRSAYVLVGIGGCGEGNGAEVYQGAVDSDSNAWVDVGFALTKGVLSGVSSSSTPKSLVDYGYTGSMTATDGAPAGSLVGGTLAETVVLNATDGKNAHTAINDASTGLAQRMRANADNVLGGIISTNAVAAPVGIRVGTVAWDATGTITSGTGVAITPKGIFAKSATATKFVLDATTGDATFSGNLTGANITGATGTFSGSLTAETLGTLAQAPVTVTTSQSVTVPAGCQNCRYELIGGGGGGGGGATGYVAGFGGGGGAGGYMSGTLSVTPGGSVAVVIGTGGSGGANTAAGGNGTNSTLAGVVTAIGGTGGGGSAAGVGGMGVGSAAGTSVPSGTSTAGTTAAFVFDGVNTTHDGAATYNGFGFFNGSGFAKFGVTGKGGATPLGDGGSSLNTGVGNAGTGYGSGGGGGGGSIATNASAVGGVGRPGVAVLTFYNANGVVLQNQLEALKAALTAQGIAVA